MKAEKNHHNDTVKCTMKTVKVHIDFQRYRNGEFELLIIGKYQKNADGIGERILSLYKCQQKTLKII